MDNNFFLTRQGDGQMSAVERLDDQDALIALQRDIIIPAIAPAPESGASPREDSSILQKPDRSARGDRLRPLLALAP